MLYCYMTFKINESLYGLFLWVSINTTSKISCNQIKDIKSKPHLHQKLIWCLNLMIKTIIIEQKVEIYLTYKNKTYFIYYIKLQLYLKKKCIL